jgi:crotonobetainyl-CoA:carnitine CoA-transferase CaiB-like acyl-CoA transferase
MQAAHNQNLLSGYPGKNKWYYMMKTQQALNAFIRQQRKDSPAHGPLADIRVVDMGTVLAAPTAAALLGDFGAEIIKVENPDSPDATRGWGIVKATGIAPFWSVVGRNKFPITLNLKSDKGKAVFLRLIEKTDVLIENMRPGAMDQLGLSHEILLEINPGLVIGTISGYGRSGPYSSLPGFGTLAEGFSGFTFLNAQPGGPPTNAPLALADYVAGIHLAYAVMIALRQQKRKISGGQSIDVSLYEPLFSFLGADFLTSYLTDEAPQPKGNELSYVVPRNNYQTKDKKWVTMSCSAEKPFERLMEMIGRPDMNQDPRYNNNKARILDENRKVVNEVIAKWVGARKLKEVLNQCSKLGITIGPIASMKDIEEDTHYNARESFIEMEDPATEVLLKMPNLPFRLAGTPGRVRFPGLPQGAANEVILSDLLQYTQDQIRDMVQNKVI